MSVRVDGDAVEFRRAFPNPGWKFDLVQGGPEAVEARFGNTENQTLKIIRVVISVVDGELDIAVIASS